MEDDRIDAERYRFIRKQHWNENTVCCVMKPKEAVKLGYDCPSGERLDEIIDELIKDKEKGKQRRVVCAALRAQSGELLLGVRHYSEDMISQINKRSDGPKFFCSSGDNQGFVDQYGKYMTRSEAYKVAKEAGQIINQKACVGDELYSEGLY